MARRHRSGYLFKRGKKYWVEYWVEGKRIRQSLDVTTLKDAKKERDRIMAPLKSETKENLLRTIAHEIEDTANGWDALEDEETEPIPIHKAWEAYLAATNRPDTGESTLRQYRFQYERFAKWLKKNHPEVITLRHVTIRIAEEYANDLRSSGLAAGTFNKHIRLLMLVFRVLKKKARLTTNPWEDITRKKENQQGRRELTSEELAIIIRSATGELHTLFAIGIYTGLRLGDCCTLRWSEVDIPRRIIIRIPRKTVRGSAKPVHIPIHPQLAAIIYEVRQTQANRQLLKGRKHKKGRKEELRETVSIPEYVLPKTAFEYLRRSDGVTDRIQSHFLNCGINVHKKGTGHQIKRDKAGLPMRNGSGAVKLEFMGKRAIVEVGFHSLRHSFVSLCREANAPLAVVESIVGHSNPAMTRHYTHVGELAASQAVAALPAFMGDGTDGHKEKSGKRDTVLDELRSMNARNWRKIRDTLIRRLQEEKQTLKT